MNRLKEFNDKIVQIAVGHRSHEGTGYPVVFVLTDKGKLYVHEDTGSDRPEKFFSQIKGVKV